MSVKVTQAFREAFELVHEAFGSSAEEIESEKKRIRAGGDTTLPQAEAYYASVATLLRSGWNPKRHPHVQLWRQQPEFPYVRGAGVSINREHL
jgi:hypothetical protein